MCYPLRFWVLAKVLNTADISEVKRNYAHFIYLFIFMLILVK